MAGSRFTLLANTIICFWFAGFIKLVQTYLALAIRLGGRGLAAEGIHLHHHWRWLAVEAAFELHNGSCNRVFALSPRHELTIFS